MMQRDPAGNWVAETGFGSSYSYASSDPMNRLDPIGLTDYPKQVGQLLADAAKKCCEAALKGYEAYLECVFTQTAAGFALGFLDVQSFKNAFIKAKQAFKSKSAPQIETDVNDAVVDSWYAILRQCKKTPQYPPRIKKHKDAIEDVLKGRKKLEELPEAVRKEASDYFDDISRSLNLDKVGSGTGTAARKVAEQLNKSERCFSTERDRCHVPRRKSLSPLGSRPVCH
jgi:hypothetical protein